MQHFTSDIVGVVRHVRPFVGILEQFLTVQHFKNLCTYHCYTGERERERARPRKGAGGGGGGGEGT